MLGWIQVQPLPGLISSVDYTVEPFIRIIIHIFFWVADTVVSNELVP